MKWVREELVAEVHPNQNKYGCVVLMVDGSKTYITLLTIKECKELAVNVVLLPAHFTNIIHPVD